MYIFRDKIKTAHHVCGREGRGGGGYLYLDFVFYLSIYPSMKDDDIYI